MFKYSCDVLSIISNSTEIGLLKGKMGVVLYLCYSDSPIISNRNRPFLLKQIYEQIPKQKSDISKLLDVGLGINHLMSHSFLQGNVDLILGDIDDCIYKECAILHSGNVNYSFLIKVLFYFSERLRYGMKDRLNRSIIQDLSYKLINDIYLIRKLDFYEEPLVYSIFSYNLANFLIVLSRFYELGLYLDKIAHIFKEMRPYVFSRMPYLQANRIVLLYAIASINKCCKSDSWRKYELFLRDNISIDDLLLKEMKDKQILLSNGVSGSYALLNLFNNITQNPIRIDHEGFYNRIVSSSAWEEFQDDSFFSRNVGLGGYIGLDLVLKYILKKK